MLPGMAFEFEEVEYPGQRNYYTDGDWYEFGPGGILAVHLADENKNLPHRYYGPGAWRRLMTDQPPGPLTDQRPHFGFPGND